MHARSDPRAINALHSDLCRSPAQTRKASFFLCAQTRAASLRPARDVFGALRTALSVFCHVVECMSKTTIEFAHAGDIELVEKEV